LKLSPTLAGIENGTIKWHLLAWLIYIVYVFLIIIPYPELYAIDIVIANLVAIWVFYSSLVFLIKVEKKKYLNGFLRGIISIGFYFGLRALMYLTFSHVFKRKDVPPISSNQFWIEGLFIYVQFFLYSLGYFFLKRSADKQRLLRISSEKNFQIQLQNAELENKVSVEESKRNLAEANFLRAQINPHFLQNTLNFFYSQSLTGKTENLSEGILLLSDMMRYSLESQGDSNARVPLVNEVQHLQNYLAINQLRFNDQLNIHFTKRGITGNLTIIPLVLLTLLENAFKHGELTDVQNPLQMQLEISNKTGEIKFKVHNKKKTGPKEKSNGIGIENTRRRLDTAYPGAYSLEINDEREFYTAMLHIRLTQPAIGNRKITTI
jgi:sensor histidine kinase YesM